MALRNVNRSELVREPYPHFALSDALTDFEQLETQFPSEERFGPQIRMDGELTYPDPEYMRLIAETAPYQRLHDWVYSADFIKDFLRLFDEEIETSLAGGELLLDPRTLPIRPEPYEMRGELISLDNVGKQDAFLFPRLDIGIGRLNYGRVNGGGGIHVDNLTRLVSVLVYMNDNASMEGGEHRLYQLRGKEPVIDKTYPPTANFMVASLQSNRALHDVNPVTAIEGLRKAMYMAVSCSVEIWRPHSDRKLQKLTKARYRPSAPVRQLKKLANAVLMRGS